MILYKNTKSLVYSLDGDANFFDRVPGVLQRDKLSPYMFGLVWFYGISTFVGYLMPNPFLCK